MNDYKLSEDFGFIGGYSFRGLKATIGVVPLGYPMVWNLQKKIPMESTLYINDIDTPAVEQFVQRHD